MQLKDAATLLEELKGMEQGIAPPQQGIAPPQVSKAGRELIGSLLKTYMGGGTGGGTSDILSFAGNTPNKGAPTSSGSDLTVASNDILDKIKLKRMVGEGARDITLGQAVALGNAVEIGKAINPQAEEKGFFSQYLKKKYGFDNGIPDAAKLGNELLQRYNASSVANINREIEKSSVGLGQGGRVGDAPSTIIEDLLNQGLVSTLQPEGPPIAKGFTVPEDYIVPAGDTGRLSTELGVDEIVGTRQVPSEDRGLDPILDPDAQLSKVASNVGFARFKADMQQARQPIPIGTTPEQVRESSRLGIEKKKADIDHVKALTEQAKAAGVHGKEALEAKDALLDLSRFKERFDQQANLFDMMTKTAAISGKKGDELANYMGGIIQTMFNSNFIPKEQLPLWRKLWQTPKPQELDVPPELQYEKAPSTNSLNPEDFSPEAAKKRREYLEQLNR